VPMDERKPKLLKALNERYGSPFDKLRASDPQRPLVVSSSNHELSRVPWLSAPEDSWP
jgi:hypothetical protein